MTILETDNNKNKVCRAIKKPHITQRKKSYTITKKIKKTIPKMIFTRKKIKERCVLWKIN